MPATDGERPDVEQPDGERAEQQPEAPMSLRPGEVDTDTDFSAGEMPTPEPEYFPLPVGATCSDLQNGVLLEPLTVHVRNERSEGIYLQRFHGSPACSVERALVQIERDGENVQVYETTTCLLLCADYVAEPGRLDTPGCTNPACSFREVTLLEPGQEFSETLDREWVRYQLPFPPECRGSMPMSGLINGFGCLRFGPLVEGAYTLTATAFTAFEDTSPEDDSACRRAPASDPSLPCLIGVPGTELTAVTTTTTPRGRIDVVFRD